MDLQRVARTRQALTRKLLLPILVVLLVFLGYLIIKWRVL